MYNEKTKIRATFSGKLGFILAAAGSAVGLGNIWRFPYLAAKHGGGIFLVVYLILVLTFGYTMIMAESAIGRMSKKSPVGAFRALGGKGLYRAGGWVNALVPILIVPYYAVIGGWVCKYLFEYISGTTTEIAMDEFFPGFIGNGGSVELWFVIFAVAALLIIILGVKKGIERVSKILMPILIGLSIIIVIYSVTRPGAMEGVKYFFIPNFKDFSVITVVSAMGQMFYSLSVAMGILITFGSYMRDDISIEDSTNKVEIFDTGIAVLAGLMIIPAVFAFSGGAPKTLNAGPSLMFITMPKIFDSMGMGKLIGIVFFLLVLFAALTSAIALLEAAVSTVEDELSWGRKKATLVMGGVMIGLGSLSALGYGPLAAVKVVGLQFLDFFDFLTNSIMMPIAALATCLLIVRVIGLKKIEEEITKDGAPFQRKAVFVVMIKYLCPIFVAIILISSVLSMLGIIEM